MSSLYPVCLATLCGHLVREEKGRWVGCCSGYCVGEMGRRRSRVEMTRQSLTRSTLMFMRQLSGHTSQIDSITYNTKRHHVLTADESTLRLWSLRKEMKKIVLPRTESCDSPARFLDLFYYENQDLYLVICKGDPTKTKRSYAGYVLGYRAGLMPALEF